MARIITKIGDVFQVKLDDNHKQFLQYVGNDLSQLNSDVVRIFKKTYPINAKPNLSEIAMDEVAFYAHCATKIGVKLGEWEKIGNISDIGTLEVLFRDTNDYGSKPGEQIKISHNWYIWRINEAFTKIGKLQGENRKAEIGVVIPPSSIVHRMRTGKYDFVYPGFE